MLTKEVSFGPGVSHQGCQFGDYVAIGPGNVLELSELDDYSYTGAYCYIQHARIGKFANIAPMVRIGATNHPIDAPALHHFIYRRSLFGFGEDDAAFFNHRRSLITTLGHDTWIGHGAIIMPGLRIGHGAVVGAGSVVTKDVPDFSIVAGNPAKLIRYRFDPETIRKLIAVAWWDWDHETLKHRVDDFWLPMEDFLARYYDESIRD